MSHPFRCRIDQFLDGHAQAFELASPVGVEIALELDAVASVIASAERAAEQGLFAAGFVAFNAAPSFDAALVARANQTSDSGVQLPLAWFGLFEEMHPAGTFGRIPDRSAGTEAKNQQLTADAEDIHAGRQQHWNAEMSRHEHAEAVAEIRASIAAGDVYLVNLTTRLRRSWEEAEDAFALYQRLTAGHAGGFHIYLETDEWAVACGSPEMFFELHGHEITTRPMKGTSPRGRWAGEDDEFARQLGASPKERAENVMVVDLLRNDLGRIAVPGSIDVPELWQVERHPTVWQLTSTVTATTNTDVGLNEVFAALFPSGSVTGAPKIAAMEKIAALEHSGRGLYCGAVGLVQPGPIEPDSGRDISARFAVAIRTAVVDKVSGSVEYGSGGGITWDSNPLAEWNEVNLKAASLLAPSTSRSDDACLLETMAFVATSSQGHGEVRNLDRHLRRLAASARYFDRPFPSDIQETVMAAVEGRCTDAKLRLTLDPSGVIACEVSDVDLLTPGPPLRLCVDDEPIASSDVVLFHKTTDRCPYDDRSFRHPHADDVLLTNERGEITESTRANLVFLLDGRWWTPPLDCGLLPGIERERLLASGQIHERILTLSQLGRVEGLATISSFRGWRAAQMLPDCGQHHAAPLEEIHR